MCSQTQPAEPSPHCDQPTPFVPNPIQTRHSRRKISNAERGRPPRGTRVGQGGAGPGQVREVHARWPLRAVISMSRPLMAQLDCSRLDRLADVQADKQTQAL